MEEGGEVGKGEVGCGWVGWVGEKWGGLGRGGDVVGLGSCLTCGWVGLGWIEEGWGGIGDSWIWDWCGGVSGKGLRRAVKVVRVRWDVVGWFGLGRGGMGWGAVGMWLGWVGELWGGSGRGGMWLGRGGVGWGVWGGVAQSTATTTPTHPLLARQTPTPNRNPTTNSHVKISQHDKL